MENDDIDSDQDCTPPDILDIATKMTHDLLSDKSRKLFEVIEMSQNNDKAEFRIVANNETKCTIMSRVYCWNNVYLQFKMDFGRSTLYKESLFFIKSMVYDFESNNQLLVTLKDKNDSTIKSDFPITTGCLWQYIDDTHASNFHYVSIRIGHKNMIQANNVCKNLYEDKELTDIELRGESDEGDSDAGVRVHRNVLATASDVLKRMVTGEWREAKEGIVRLPASKDTLEDLKAYIYLRKLPDDSPKCLQLLSLANYFMMSELAEACSTKIMCNFKPEKTMDIWGYYVNTKNVSQLEVLMTHVVGQQQPVCSDLDKAATTERTHT